MAKRLAVGVVIRPEVGVVRRAGVGLAVSFNVSKCGDLCACALADTFFGCSNDVAADGALTNVNGDVTAALNDVIPVGDVIVDSVSGVYGWLAFSALDSAGLFSDVIMDDAGLSVGVATENADLAKEADDVILAPGDVTGVICNGMVTL